MVATTAFSPTRPGDREGLTGRRMARCGGSHSGVGTAGGRYPARPDSGGTPGGITARFRLAASLAELGRYAEAEQRYQEVARKAGAKNIYRYTARLGVGAAQLAQGKGDAAVTTFKDLASDTNSSLPTDSVLMQLGRAAQMAGKKDDATRAYTRVVEEFPQSLYASEAKEKIAGLKKA